MSDNTKIPWADSTFNPITGCLHGCEYCYARKIARRFAKRAGEPLELPNDGGFMDVYDISGAECETGENHVVKYPCEGLYPYGFDPTFHEHRLENLQHWKSPRSIFVGSMCDIFGKWVPDEWIEAVILACLESPQHQYLFLTKNPKRYDADIIRLLDDHYNNFWMGATVTTYRQLLRMMKASESVMIRYLSVEPIMDEMHFNSVWYYDSHLSYVEWVIIGAETGNRKDKVIPKKRWIENIVRGCKRKNIPVFMKDSLIPVVGEADMLREFPPALQPKPKRKKSADIK